MTVKLQSNVVIECDECHSSRHVNYWLNPGITKEELIEMFRQDSLEYGWHTHNDFVFCGGN